MRLNLQLNQIDLNLVRDGGHSYKRFANSFVIPYSIRTLAAMEQIVERIMNQDLSGHRCGKERVKDIVDQEAYTTLLAQLTFLRKAFIRFPENLDSVGMENITNSIKQLRKAISRFERKGVQPIFAFINKIDHFIRNFENIEEVQGYWVDLFGTYRMIGDESFEINVFEDIKEASAVYSMHGNEYTRIYKVCGVQSKDSEQILPGVHQLNSEQIFSITSC